MKNIVLKFMKLILILRVGKNGRNYILFRIDVYFFKYNLAVEFDEKGHTDRDLIFEKKTRSPRKKTGL